ncbi:hypothetical protein PoB_007071900 [Plakobranchus ocellatus]|uniref:Uncharacterized protein n=1 Tax=Plakobranchus ocellatus TaxID=259542 RepID=A0AAV4DJ49_9GAST|nr:hypothetical protein PoB_007071900 [Plakobranchus ocellatus]
MDRMLHMASGKAVPVVANCTALGNPKKSGNLRVPILREETGGREVCVVRDTGYEGVVVRKEVVEEVVINLRSPYLCGKVKVLCIPHAICDVIFVKVERARGSEDPYMSVMVDAAKTRAQALRETAMRLLRLLTVERHGGVDADRLIKLQQEDPAMQGLVSTRKTPRRGNKTISFEKIKGIVYRSFEDPGGNSA